MWRDAPAVALLGCVFAVGTLGYGYVIQREVETQLDGLVGELGEAVAETAAASLRATLSVLDELERELAAGLRLKAEFLADGPAPDSRMLQRFALAAGLRHVYLFDAGGRLVARGEDFPAPSHGGDGVLGELALAREEAARTLVQETNQRLLLREWRVPGAGRKPLLALLKRLPDGRAVVLVQDAEVFARVRDAAGAKTLARRLEAETRIQYVRYGAPPPDPDPERVRAFTRTIDGGADLHVGIDRTPILRTLRVQRRSTLLNGALLVAFATIASWGLLRLRRSRAALAERLRREEHLSGLGRLAASITHEVRNPLNAIGLAVQRVQRSGDAPPDVVRLAGVIAEEVERLNRTVEDVLRYARPSSARLEPIAGRQLLGAVESLARPEAEARAIDLRFSVPEHLALRCDADLIKGAAWNLVRNAILASPEGSSVAVELRQNGDGVALEVADAGPGVPDGMKRRIFEPFHSKQGRGAGLGLPLALAAAQAHGGTIEVEDAPGGGAVFRLCLPAEGAGE